MSHGSTTVPALPKAAAGVLARLNVDDDEVRYWAADVAAPTAVALRELLTALEPLARQLAARAVEGSSADQRGVTAALILRCWALGVWSTARDIRSVLGAVLPPLPSVLPGSEHLAWLTSHYVEDPAAARRDGFDLLAGDVLG
jgi:hypothetical protein